MARNKQVRADTEALKKLSGSMLDTRPLIAYTMKKSGCTLAEIGEVFGVSSQRAKGIVERAERLINES